MNTIRIKDVAAAVGLAESSVSRILNQVPGYSYDATTQKRVREAALNLGYHANGAARLLAQHTTTLVGLAVRLEQRPHLNRLVVAVHQELEKLGYHPLPIEPRQLVPGFTSAPFSDPKLLAGIISADLLMEQEMPEFYAMLQRQLPVVAVYPVRSPHVEVVTTDRSRIIELAVAHLVELGHRRIAFVADTESEVLTATLKVEGWKRAVKKHRLNPDSACVVSLSALLSQPIHEVGAEIVRRLSALRPRPTAMICAGETITLSCLARLAEAGWKVPQELSVVSYGAGEQGDLASPPLTIVLQPTERLARLAAERLVHLIEAQTEDGAAKNGVAKDVAAPQRHLIEPTLLVRGSTARCPA